MQFETLLKLIRVKDESARESLTDLLMVTGPSSSGKTTTANLLAKYLSEDGYNCTVISLDDYYYDIETTHRIQIEKGLVPKGSTEFDYETIEAIDVEYFRRQMKDYTEGRSIRLPKFDFTVGKRSDSGRVVESTNKDMIIVEGIHAFQPVLTEGLNFSTSLKIYICPFDSYVSEYEEKAYLVEPHQIRFMRAGDPGRRAPRISARKNNRHVERRAARRKKIYGTADSLYRRFFQFFARI